MRSLLERARRIWETPSVPEVKVENLPAAQEDNLRLAVYQVVAARRDTYEAVLWQVPALSLTAQAFLLTIALGGDTSPSARRLASLLSLISALASIQLLAKHRYFEEVDSRLCERLEADLNFQKICGYLPHTRTKDRRQLNDPKPSGWIAYSSFKIWRLLLGLFALAAVIAIILSFSGGL